MEPMTGVWEDRIYDGKGDVVKTDIVELEQRGTEVTGTIRRKVPAGQEHRRWTLSGKVFDSTFIAIFWSGNPGITSHGCWYLDYSSDTQLTGYYLKMDGDSSRPVVPTRIDLVRI
jgi:hypothetical protein